MKKFISLLLSSLFLIFLFTGCEKKDETPEVEEKVWLIGTEAIYEPFEYYDVQGNLVGIDVDLIEAIANDQGFSYEIKPDVWDNALQDAQNGKTDALLSGISITQSRIADGWHFSKGYFTATQTLAVKSDSKITGFEDLRGQQVSVLSNSIAAYYLYSIYNQYGFSISEYDNSIEAYEAVVDGTSVAVFADTPVLETLIFNGSYDFKILNNTATKGQELGLVVFNDSNQELIDMFNKGLTNIKMSGEYYEIVQKYLGEYAEVNTQ